MFEDILGSVNSARNSVQNALGVTNNSAGLGSFRGCLSTRSASNAKLAVVASSSASIRFAMKAVRLIWGAS